MSTFQQTSILVLLFAILLSGCSTGSALVTGIARPALDPSQVTIYFNEVPENYETVGIVKAEAEGVDQQHSLNLATEELKKQAAKIGANGVILKNMGQKSESYMGYIPSYTPYSAGTFYAGTSEIETISGEAIFMP
jgi:hypothetical protein